MPGESTGRAVERRGARACLRVRDRAGFRGACDEDVCEVRARAAFISRCTSRAQRAPPFALPHFKP